MKQIERGGHRLIIKNLDKQKNPNSQNYEYQKP